jgi:hypothetical protein
MAKPKPTDTADTPISDAEIAAKVAAGLTRDQAIEVITNQRLNDAQSAE